MVILGPTAVGKSSLGLNLVDSLSGEIVNADSLQVYRYLNIGTAKPTNEELLEYSHHLVDIVDPDEEFNAGLFRDRAANIINELNAKGRNTILVGGTYLYVKVLLSGLIEGLPSDPEVRDDIKKIKTDFGIPYVYEQLCSIDPEAATKIHPNDYVRLERALEVYYITGQKISDLHTEHSFSQDEFDYIKIGVFVEREHLRKRIDERTDTMMENGFLDEVRNLRDLGFGANLKPMKSIGYKQINDYLDGEHSLERAVELIKRDTKRFAKRQMTWLRKDKEISWHELPGDFDKVLNVADKFFSN